MEKLINEFSLGLFVWQTILFILLILLLKKFAWKPILNAVNEREEGIKMIMKEVPHMLLVSGNLESVMICLCQNFQQFQDLKNKCILNTGLAR